RVISDRNAATSRNRSACIASVSNNSPNSCAGTPGVTTSLRSDIQRDPKDSLMMPNDFASNASSARDHLVPRVELQWVDNQFSSPTESHSKKSSDSINGQSRSRTTNSGFVSSREGNTTFTHPSTTTCGSSTKMGPTI